MNEKIDQLYCDSNVQILFDKLDNTITYYTQHRKSIPPIHLDDKLQFIQLYKDSGDLIVSCSSGTKKIYICKRNRLYTLKHESNNLVYILDQSFIVDDTDPIPKVWQIYDDKLKLLTYNKYHINNDYLPLSAYTIYKGTDNCKYLVTSQSKIKIVITGFMLLNYNSETINQTNSTIINELYSKIKYDKKTTNSSNTLKILYSYDDSAFELYRTINDSEILIEKIDKHACTLKKIQFINDNFFISLDSCSKLKIWFVNQDTYYVCQTLTPDDYFNHIYYNDFIISENMKEIQLLADNDIYIYTLALNTYKPKHKNNLLIFDRHIFKTTMDTTSRGTDSVGLTSKTFEPIPKDTDISNNKQNDINNAKEELQTISKEPEQEIIREVIPRKGVNQSSHFVKKQARIYIGIDFGTSRTKVSFNNETSGHYEPLNFKSMIPDNYKPESDFDLFIIPSIAKKSGNAIKYGYETYNAKGIEITNFKQAILKRNVKTETMLIAAGFIAYVMKISQDTIRKLIPLTDNDEFIFSVCLPVEQMNNNVIVERFQSILLLSKKLLFYDCFNDMQKMSKCEKLNSTQKLSNSNIRIEIIPESIAEILDFYERRAKTKLYAIYDFGAGTTDLTIFYADKSLGKIDILGAKIVYNGYSYIDNLKEQNRYNEEEVLKYYSDIWNKFKDSNVWQRVKGKIRGLEAMRFFYDLTVFGGGGGFNDDTLRSVFSNIPLYDEQTNEYIKSPDGIIKLEEPIDWDSNLPPYFRYAVSFGLTKKPEETLMRYKLPKDCKTRDVSPKIKELNEPDEIIPDQNWLGK